MIEASDPSRGCTQHLRDSACRGAPEKGDVFYHKPRKSRSCSLFHVDKAILLQLQQSGSTQMHWESKPTRKVERV